MSARRGQALLHRVGRPVRARADQVTIEPDIDRIMQRNQTIDDTFESCKSELEQRQTLRGEYRDWVSKLEALAGRFNSVLSGIFSVRYESAKDKTVNMAIEVLDEIQSILEDKERDNQFNEEWFSRESGGDLGDHFNELLSRLSKYCVIFRYIEKEEFASKEEVSRMLGLTPELNVQSYLDGVLGIAEDLVRYATIGVAFGFYSRPIIVGEFLNKVFQGFVSIGKKDERLRNKMRQFESEIKKLEHVMFEVSVRSLTDNTIGEGHDEAMANP